MKIVHIVAGLWKDTGGPAEVIPNLCRAQCNADTEVYLCTLCGDTAPQVLALKDSNVIVRSFQFYDPIIRYSPALASYLLSLGDIDIVHNHGQWLWPNWFSQQLSKKTGAKLVTTPHGCLVQGMLNKSSFKKNIAWNLFDKKIVSRADLIHALSNAEKTDMSIKLNSFSAKIKVIPNGVNLATDAGNNVGLNGGRLLFLSRVAPIKGIIPLLQAWSNIEHLYPKWVLRVVGPVDPDIQKQIYNMVADADRVELIGPVYNEDRWNEYRKASAFILPSFGEGLPTAILEAAAHRLPIITTSEANFQELNMAGGSLLCFPDVVNIQATLNKFFIMPSSSHIAMGACAEQLIKSSYQWDLIGRQWIATYQNLLELT